MLLEVARIRERKEGAESEEENKLLDRMDEVWGKMTGTEKGKFA